MRFLRPALVMLCIACVIAALFALLPTSCLPWRENSSATTAQSTPTTSRSVIDTLVRQVLNNMHLHAWNPKAVTHGITTGGLYINWRMSDPTNTNATQPGSDGDVQHNHDPQVDLLYLTALAEYQQLHPPDHSYDLDQQRALTQVRQDFQRYNLPKGWIYFYLLNVGETHYPYALPGEPPEQWPRISGVHGVFKHLDDEIVGGKLVSRKTRFFNARKLAELRARQVAAVKYLDNVVEELFDIVPKNTYITITSDHGELFGEDGYFGHGPIVHEKVLEVPFVEGKLR